MLLRGESVAFLWPTKCRVRSCSGIYRNGCGFPPSLDPHFHRALTRCNVLPEHCSSGRLNAACNSTPHGKLGRFEMEINMRHSPRSQLAERRVGERLQEEAHVFLAINVRDRLALARAFVGLRQRLEVWDAV